MMDRNNSIPEEILFEILTLLPVKSLCRFRCISKSWFSIISDPNFANARLEHSKSRPKLLISINKWNPLLSYLKSGENHKYLYSIDYPEVDDDDDDDDLSAKPLRLHATAHGSVYFYSPKIESTSNGLICCRSRGIRIGNPFTRDFDLIQYPLDRKPSIVRCFLGFDPVDKRHVMLNVEEINGYFGSPAKINVVSLPEREVHEISPHCISDDFGHHWISLGGDCSICINGIIYFIAHSNFSGSCNSSAWLCILLYAFDVRLEFVEMIKDPPDRVAWVGSNNNMDEMKLWILENLKKQSWSVKSFVVPWGRSEWKLSTKQLSGSTPRGDLIFATALSGGRGSIDMFLYNIDTNTLRRFNIDGFSPIPHDYQLARFNFLIESLHSPKRKQLLHP